MCANAEMAARHFAEATMLLVTEEALATRARALTAAIKTQPSWSAIPILIFFARTSSRNAVQLKAEHPLLEFADWRFCSGRCRGPLC